MIDKTKTHYLDLNIPLSDEFKILCNKFTAHGYKGLTLLFKSEIDNKLKRAVINIEDLKEERKQCQKKIN